MNNLSAGAEQEIQAGRAVPLEVALKHILESVEEVVSYSVGEAQTLNTDGPSPSSSEASVHFSCRLHDPISIPLALFYALLGIVSNEMVNHSILLLRTHTGETITFKR